MKLDVIVLHNMTLGDMFFEYRRTSELAHAHTFHVEADNPVQAAHLIWTLTNVDGPNELRLLYPHLSQYADQVETYRARMNRSTSVSDVVVVMEGEQILRTLACARIDWTEIPEVTANLSDVDNHQEQSDAFIRRMALAAAQS